MLQISHASNIKFFKSKHMILKMLQKDKMLVPKFQIPHNLPNNLHFKTNISMFYI